MLPSGSPVSARTRLPPFARAVFEQVRTDCEALRITSEELADPTWEDLYRFEITLLGARGELDLRRSAWFIRLRFKNVAGEGAYAQYLASSPPDPATADRDILYADLLSVLRRTYYLMLLIPASDHVKRLLFLGSAVSGLLAIFGIASIIFWPHDNYVFIICLLCGAIGGVMSLIQRLKQLPDGDPLLFRLSGSATIIQSLAIPPITGAVFAALLALLFAANALSGTVFPKINTTGGTLTQFIFGTRPADGHSFALLFIWSFLAGFAERLVPDTIDRFVAKSKPSN